MGRLRDRSDKKAKSERVNGEQKKKLDGQFLKDKDEKASENSWLIVAKERISEERNGRVFRGGPESGTWTKLKPFGE